MGVVAAITAARGNGDQHTASRDHDDVRHGPEPDLRPGASQRNECCHIIGVSVDTPVDDRSEQQDSGQSSRCGQDPQWSGVGVERLVDDRRLFRKIEQHVVSLELAGDRSGGIVEEPHSVVGRPLRTGGVQRIEHRLVDVGRLDRLPGSWRFHVERADRQPGHDQIDRL